MSDRRRRAIAIGRWDDPAKHRELLHAALRRYRRSGGDWELMIVGHQSDYFADIPRCLTVERLEPPYIANLMRTSRVLLLSSRWEGVPMVCLEAIASGCSLVITPLSQLTPWFDTGEALGTASRYHFAWSFLRAMRREFHAWDTGQRDTTAITAAAQQHQRHAGAAFAT